jgi:hypothetical protein
VLTEETASQALVLAEAMQANMGRANILDQLAHDWGQPLAGIGLL